MTQNNTPQQNTEQEIRQELYRLSDKVVINQRAVDDGNITPTQREELNMKLFNNFLSQSADKIRKSILEEVREKVEGMEQKEISYHPMFGSKNFQKNTAISYNKCVSDLLKLLSE